MKACNYNYKKETNWKKANKNSTNDKEGCFKCFVLFQKSFHIFLGKMLSFNLVFMASSFSIHDKVSESKKENTKRPVKERAANTFFIPLKIP